MRNIIKQNQIYLTLWAVSCKAPFWAMTAILVQAMTQLITLKKEDRFCSVDDLEILELIMMTGILQDYNILDHIPSDIPLDHQFLPPNSYNTKSNLDQLSSWTLDNKMLLNPLKCNYLIFSRSQEKFVTRLTVDGEKINQMSAVKILGCWIDEDAGTWSTNTRELCRGAYARLSMLSK